MGELTWRPMAAADLAAVVAIADAVHLDFYERPEVLAERLALAPGGCRVLHRDGVVKGYVLSHPWRLGDVPPLDTLLHRLPDGADTWYIHDLCLVPAARGTGAATALVGDLLSHAGAQGFARVSLVAVNGSVPFWTRAGFAVVENAALSQKLLTYEPEARYMSRTLS